MDVPANFESQKNSGLMFQAVVSKSINLGQLLIEQLAELGLRKSFLSCAYPL